MKKFYVLALLPVLVASGYCEESLRGRIEIGEAPNYGKLESSGVIHLKDIKQVSGGIHMTEGATTYVAGIPYNGPGELKISPDGNLQVIVDGEDVISDKDVTNQDSYTPD
jgi:hypothetical protein